MKQKLWHYLCNLLYKCNLIHRYTYKTDNRNIIARQEESDIFTTSFFSVKVVYDLVEDKHIDMDYFYVNKRDGSKKIILVNKDIEETRHFIYSLPKDISVIIGDRYYNIVENPRVKAITLPPFSFDREIEESFNVKTITEVYDFSLIRRLLKVTFVNVNTFEDLKKEEFEYIRKESVRDLKNLLNKYSLMDFAVGAFDN